MLFPMMCYHAAMVIYYGLRHVQCKVICHMKDTAHETMEKQE